MRLMKPVALALLIALVPTAAMAQNTQSSGKKLKWIALGGLIGGATLGAFAAFSGDKRAATSNVTALSSCNSAVQNALPPSASVVVACIVAVPIPPATSGPITLPQPLTSAAGSVPVSVLALSSPQQRGINWKLAGSAIGASSVGGLLLYRYHVRVKKADVSLRRDGAVEVAFTW